jgi:hypothetical protein
MEVAGGAKRLFELPDADHVFSDDDARTAAEEVAGWVRRLEL